jgi:perosamine synthetase
MNRNSTNALNTIVRTQMSDAHLFGIGAIAKLEARLRDFYGMKHALLVANATLGLLAIAKALDLAESDFVTTPYTYGATLAGWLWLGNRPVFADIDPHTLTLDPRPVRQAITSRTKAILAVDLFGIPADMAALRRLADEFGIWYIADAAQSLGAYRDGRPASSLADALVVSFTVGKTIFAGEGGAVLTNHDALYEKLLWYTQHPERQRRELGLNLVNEFALNARIHPIAAQCADGVFQDSLKRLKKRQRQCYTYIGKLNSLGLTEPIRFREEGIEPSFFRLTAAWKGKAHEARLVKQLGPVFVTELPIRLLYQQPAFITQYGRRFTTAPQCPEAERQHAKRFCLISSTTKEGCL